MKIHITVTRDRKPDWPTIPITKFDWMMAMVTIVLFGLLFIINMMDHSTPPGVEQTTQCSEVMIAT